MLRAGLIGFPSSVKTALFQLLTSAREAPRPGGRVEKCGIEACKEMAKRHLSHGKVTAALPDVRIATRGRSIGLCSNHWRDYKKATKKDREIERSSWDQ